MTGAHLGGRGARRRRSCSATAAPCEGTRHRGHADGRHHPRPQQRSVFSPNIGPKARVATSLASQSSSVEEERRNEILREYMMMNSASYLLFFTAAGGDLGFDLGQGRCAAKEWTALARGFFRGGRRLSALFAPPAAPGSQLFRGAAARRSIMQVNKMLCQLARLRLG